MTHLRSVAVLIAVFYFNSAFTCPDLLVLEKQRSWHFLNTTLAENGLITFGSGESRISLSFKLKKNTRIRSAFMISDESGSLYVVAVTTGKRIFILDHNTRRCVVEIECTHDLADISISAVTVANSRMSFSIPGISKITVFGANGRRTHREVISPEYELTSHYDLKRLKSYLSAQVKLNTRTYDVDLEK